MSEILSIDEIESRYPNEWILIGDPQTNEALAVLRGTVLWHSTDRDEVYQKAVELRPKHVAFHYSGTVPQEDMEFAL
jgi:hypothetical protein